MTRLLPTAEGLEKVKTHEIGDRIKEEPRQKFVSIDVVSSFLDKVRDSIGPAGGEQDRKSLQNAYANGGASSLAALLRMNYGSSYEDLGSVPRSRQSRRFLRSCWTPLILL